MGEFPAGKTGPKENRKKDDTERVLPDDCPRLSSTLRSHPRAAAGKAGSAEPCSHFCRTWRAEKMEPAGHKPLSSCLRDPIAHKVRCAASRSTARHQQS